MYKAGGQAAWLGACLLGGLALPGGRSHGVLSLSLCEKSLRTCFSSDAAALSSARAAAICVLDASSPRKETRGGL